MQQESQSILQKPLSVVIMWSTVCHLATKQKGGGENLKVTESHCCNVHLGDETSEMASFVILSQL